MDVRKTMTDAGYIAIGLGVMSVQQAQVRRRKMQERLEAAPGCVSARAREAQARFAQQGRQGERLTRQAADRAEAQVRTNVARAQELRREVAKRVEPLIEQVAARVSEVPEKVVQAMEPVAARVRELAGSAA
jgi:hypothetical protein